MVNKTKIVVKSNALIEAAYKLSVMEQRIVLACLSQIDPRESITDNQPYLVPIGEVSRLAGKKRQSIYEEVREAALRLYRRELWIKKKPNGEGKKEKIIPTRWVQAVPYVDGECNVELHFTKYILPYISDLRKEFTRYELDHISKFNSAYSIRLYELMCQYKAKSNREISIDDLRYMFQIEDKYKVTKDLRRYVIDPALKDINEKTPLEISCEAVKEGRKITRFRFQIAEKEKQNTQVISTESQKPRLTKAYIEKHARIGETWDQARERLRKEISR